MDVETVLSLDYETQHFEFHPRVLIDEIYNVYYENLFEALNNMQDYLFEENKAITSYETIKANTDSLFQELVKQLDKAMDKLETFSNINILSIPSNVVLPEDKVHITSPYTKKDEEKLDSEIKELINKIIEVKARRTFLRDKISEQKIVKKELIDLKKKLQDLSSVITNAQFTKEDIQVTVAKCTELCDLIKQRQELQKLIT